MQGVSKDGNPISDINNGTSTPAAEITVKTGPDGIARAKLTLGDQTSVSPYYKQYPNADNKQYWEQVGLNLVSVNATTTQTGNLFTDKPFETYGRPDVAKEMIKLSPTTDIYGPPGIFVSSLWVKVVDQYGNSVSDKTVKYKITREFLGTPPTLGSISAKLFGEIKECPGVATINCPLAKEADVTPFETITEHFGAQPYLILGNTENTKFTITASGFKDYFDDKGLRIDNKTALNSIDFKFYTKSVEDGYVSVYSPYAIDEKVNNIDAGKAGEIFPEPLTVAMFYTEKTKEGIFKIMQVVKDPPSDAPYRNDAKVEFVVASGDGGLQPVYYQDVDLETLQKFNPTAVQTKDNPLDKGTYSAKLKFGDTLGKNTINAIGTVTASVPSYDPQGNVTRTDKPLAASFPIEIWGLKIIVPSYQMIMLNSEGYLGADMIFPHTILPFTYDNHYISSDLSLEILEKNSTGNEVLVGFVQADNDKKLILSQGTAKFNMDNTYYAQVVLNRGTKAEVRSEKTMLLNAALIPDYDRNGVINDSDRKRTFSGDTFYFWINDDDDEGEMDGSDIPGEIRDLLGSLDCDNLKVDGIRDLIDFFPVYLDIKDLLKVFDTTKYTYKLKSENESLRMVLTTIDAQHSRYYLTGDDNNLEPVITLGNANTHIITKGGIVLNDYEEDPAFLQRIRDLAGQGVILLEGKKKDTRSYLELEVTDKQNNNVVASVKLNLSLDGVEQMFRHKNLVEAGGGPEPKTGLTDGEPDRLYQPLNYPDKECTGNESGSGKNFIFLHGYNVNGKEARGWQAEMFKRMFWSGSKARFWGVTWYGWYTQIGLDPVFDSKTINFYRNVVNAFQTAEALKDFLATTVAGEKIVAAHSLGNMVVSSAIADYNAPVDKYFLLNAAVALEAFDSTEAENSELIPPGWNIFLPRLRASEWYKLFEGQKPMDYREQLTWKGRFTNINKVTAYNFFSTGDEVVSGSWQWQEQLKGSVPLVSYYGGWVLNMDDYLSLDIFAHPERANALSDAELRERPLFDKHGLIAPLLTPDVSGSNSAKENRNELLARAFPATTAATGRSSSLAFKQLNYEMQSNLFMTSKTKGTDKITFWPITRDKKWLHSDVKDVAYTYTYSLFDNFVKMEKENLSEK